ncbi:MAG: hypothetical protein IKZ04_04115 [Spirochaetaceae bacterium]|nr:hypothetical protein [Spirochaetaceae bacterium]
MLKKIIFCFILFVFSFGIYAQVGVDPNDSFYDYLEVWETQGLVSNLPPLRPYPVALVKDILKQVMSGTNEKAKNEAEMLSEKLFGKAFHVEVSGDVNLKISDDADAKQAVGFGGVNGDIAFQEKLSASYKLNIAAALNAKADVIPVFTTKPYTFRDPADLGPLELFLEMDGNISYGNPGFYIQGGISHNSFGDFYNRGVVLSPDAQHTANFSVVVNPGRWSYTHSLFALGASNNAGKGVYPNKFMMLHSLDGQIFDWLTASFYETVVYGDRFDPSYFVPMPFMVPQGITGFDDNLIMGVAFTVKPFDGFSWSTDVFIDDISVNDLFKFKFDTKIRGALQTGVKYSPLNSSFVDLVQMDYTLITPYMYAHKQNIYNPEDCSYITGGSKAINYQAYTNAGKPMGSQLAPNSDRIALCVKAEPVKGLNVKLSGCFIRHANVNESITMEEAIDYMNAPSGYFLTDGSINNHPHIAYLQADGSMKYKYMSSAWNRFMFMSQKTKMYVVQAGLDVNYDLPELTFGQFSVGFGYLFEYIKNWGVQENMFPGNGTKDFTNTATEADVEKAIAEWKSNLKNIMNNYVTVSVKYRY